MSGFAPDTPMPTRRRVTKRERELQDALRPFAAAAEVWTTLGVKQPEQLLIYGSHNEDGPKISVADLLAAHAALLPTRRNDP